jgi:hypothetical protein
VEFLSKNKKYGKPKVSYYEIVQMTLREVFKEWQNFGHCTIYKAS